MEGIGEAKAEGDGDGPGVGVDHWWAARSKLKTVLFVETRINWSPTTSWMRTAP
jgi:hypothetical protein